MKATIFDTRSSAKNDYNVPYVQLLNQILYKEGNVGLLVQGLVKLTTLVKITNTLWSAFAPISFSPQILTKW